MKTVLVTGSAGLLGSAVVRAYEKENIKVIKHTRKDCNLLSKEETKSYISLMRDNGVDTVIHCAADVGGVLKNTLYTQYMFSNNLLINNNIIDACHLSSIPNFVNILSTCIFPQKSTYPLTVDQIKEGLPHPSTLGYSLAKRIGMLTVQSYKRVFNRNWINIVPTNIYGPCFSSDTDVLTIEGIKKINDIKTGEFVYTLNPDNHNVEITKVISVQNTLTTNEFFNFKGKGVDFKVTPDHKMYFKTSAGFVKKPAEYFRNKVGKKYGQIIFSDFKINNSNDSNDSYISLKEYIDNKHIIYENHVKDFKRSRSNKIPINYNLYDWAEFLGWFISEGSLNNTQITISQDKGKNNFYYNKIEKLLLRMNIPYHKNDYGFHFTSRLFYNYICKEIGIGSHNKRIPKEFLNYNSPYKIKFILYETLMSGDGHKNKLKYTTVSNQLKLDFIHLAFLLGKKAKSNKNVRIISIRNQNSSAKYKNIDIEKVNNEKVYCITTEKNNIIYAGRNLKLNWIGQCDNFNLENSHVIPALINKANAISKGNEDFVIWGDGTSLRQFIFSDDLAQLIKWAESNWHEDEPFMAVNPEEYTITELSFMIAKKFNISENRIKYDFAKPGGIPRMTASTNAFWYHFTPLERGLDQTINWYKNNYQNIRK
jgi:nucleoside-diphosphate-sugar epimerase